IIGGTRAGTNEFPFMASVLSNGRQTCGGSIIGSNWILTAAHCPVLPSSLSVVVGTGTATSAAATAQFKVSRVIPHPQYDSSTMHQDIALLRLATPIKLSAGKAQQIGILTSSISDGDQLTLAGYGWVNNKGSTSSNLMKVGLTVGDVDTCQKGAGEYTDSNGIFVCTIPQDGESGCFGDSGGPLFLASSNGGFAQAGIVSFDANYITPSSRACASKGSVSFYTRVSNYIPWISQ
ncbi:trypsin-like serine protease, partial [Ramicandelaber brevisporus]